MANRIKNFEVLNSSKTRLKIRSSIKCIATLQDDVVLISNTMNDIANDFSELTVNQMKSSDFVDASRDVVKKTNLINSYMKDCMKAILLDTQTRIESIAENSQAYRDDLATSQAVISAALNAFDGLGDVKMSDVKMDLASSGGATKTPAPATTEPKTPTVAPDSSDSDTPTAAADIADTTETTTEPISSDTIPETTNTPNTVYDPTKSILFGAADTFLKGDVSVGRISESSHLINPNSIYNYASGDTSIIVPSAPNYPVYDGIN